ncbi:MAG: hypothetical protein N2V73_02555 [Candidatus Methanospirare jalkutatii]|nr:hypothetical protein [Candidatus Methanospirare jalkutatii]
MICPCTVFALTSSLLTARPSLTYAHISLSTQHLLLAAVSSLSSLERERGEAEGHLRFECGDE